MPNHLIKKNPSLFKKKVFEDIKIMIDKHLETVHEEENKGWNKRNLAPTNSSDGKRLGLFSDKSVVSKL